MVIATVVVLIGLGPLQGLFTALHFPYYLTYFNPLAGGSRTAPAVLFVGWGEGLDQAAAWLNRQPDAADSQVVSWYAHGPLSYLFDGKVMGLLSGSRMPWLDADFVVLYLNQIQRRIPTPAAVNYLLAQQPVHTVNVAGLELARIYDMHQIIQEHSDANRPLASLPVSAAWNDLHIDALHSLNEVDVGETLPISLGLSGRVDGSRKISARLISADGTLVAQQDVPAREDVALSLFVPPDAAPGAYVLWLLVYDDETLDPIPDVQGQDLVRLAPIQVIGSADGVLPGGPVGEGEE